MVLQVLVIILILVISHSQVQDRTQVPCAYGSEIVEAVYNKIRESCVFPHDKLFLRRLAFVETHDGNDRKTYRPGYDGGIWQIDQEMFNNISHSVQARSLYEEISSKFDIDWNTVQWPDLKKPLYSGIAAALYMATIQEEVPGLMENQGPYYGKYFRVNAHSAHNFYLAARSLDMVCPRTNLDLAFLVDASGSVSTEDFENAKRFAGDVIKNFQIGPSDVRIAFVTFGTGYMSEFNFSTYTSKQAVLKAVEGIVKRGGGTETDLALNFASKTLFTTDMGSRNGSSKVILLITDGKSNASFRTIAAAVEARKKGILIFTIGVGRQVDKQELVDVANKPSCTHVMQLEDFSHLNALVSEIQQVSCKAPAVLNPGFYSYPCSKGGLYQIDSNGTTMQVTIHVSDGMVDIYGSLTNPTPSKDVNSFYSTSIPATSSVALMIEERKPVYITIASTDPPNGCTGTYTIKVGNVEKVNANTFVTCVEHEITNRCSVVDIYKRLFSLISPPYTIPNPCVRGHPRFVSHPIDQTKFIFCGSNGVMFVFMCAPHYIYNPSVLDCVSGEPSTTLTTTSSTSSTTTTNKPISVYNPCTDEHIKSGDFFFPYPPDETKYIDCSNWQIGYIKDCEEGKIWHQRDLICTFKYVIVDPTKRVFDKTFPNPCKSHLVKGDLFFYPHPTDRQKYVHCDQFGDAFEKTCPENRYWHQDVLQCMHEGLLIG